MSKTKCPDCNKKVQILPNAQVYYCCDESKKICFFCRSKKCQHCNKKRQKHFIEKCKKCKASNTVDDCFLDIKSGKYLCSECILDAYQKFQYNNDIFVDKATYPKSQVQVFLQNYCSKCFIRINTLKSQELQKGKYLCNKCYQKQRQITFNRCNICNKILSKDEIGAKDQGFMVCKLCANDSFLEQKNMEIQKQVLQEQLSNHEHQKILKNDKKQQKSKEEDKEKNSVFNQVNPDKKLIIKNEKEKKIKASSIKSPKNKEKNFFNSPDQKREYEKAIKQKKQQNQRPKQSKIEEEEIKMPDKKQQKEEQLKEMQMDERVMKRVNSSKLLQDVQLQVEKDNEEDLIVCLNCGFEIEGIFSISGTSTQNIMCRGCFTLQNNKNIGFNNRFEQKNKKSDRNQHLTVSKYQPKDIKKEDEPVAKKKNDFGMYGSYIDEFPQTSKYANLLKSSIPNKPKVNCTLCLMLKSPCTRHR